MENSTSRGGGRGGSQKQLVFADRTLVDNLHYNSKTGMEAVVMETLIDLDAELATRRTQVESALDRLIPASQDAPVKLREAMRYSLLAGGKRLRPVLTLLACEACGGDVEAAIPAACALEMIHTYSLIHDDLPAMDNDSLRRGKPTNHVVFGDATAILAGDGLLTLAFETIASIQPAVVAIQCSRRLAVAAGWEGMVGGQQADLDAEQSSRTHTIEELEQVHRRKTGKLLSCAVALGGVVAQAGPDLQRRLELYGDALGHAFQITDDLLDQAGDPSRMGKSSGKDAASGKLTYPSLLGVDESWRRANQLVADAIDAIQPLEARGNVLRELAEFVLRRDH